MSARWSNSWIWLYWPTSDNTSEIGGKAFAPQKKKRLALPVDGNECQTWADLISARLSDGDGVDIGDLGSRVAPSGALRAEATNVAARHIHSLRKRLTDPQDVLTVQGHFRFREGLKVGRVT